MMKTLNRKAWGTDWQIVCMLILGVGLFQVSAQSDPATLWVAGGHSKEVNCVVYSPNGRWLASASDDATIKLWSIQDGKLAQSLFGHNNDVQSVAFSAQGDWLLSAGKDDQTILWRVEDGAILWQQNEDYNLGEWTLANLRAAALSPDGRWVASVATYSRPSFGENRTVIRLRDAADGHLIRLLQRSEDDVRWVAFSPDSNYLASAGSAGVSLWRVADGSLVRTFSGHTQRVLFVAFSPDGLRLASASEDTTVKIYQTDNGQLLQTLIGHTDRVRSLAFSTAGTRLASVSFDQTLKLWEVANGQEIMTVNAGTAIRSIAFSPDDQRLAMAGKNDEVAEYSVLDGTSVRTFTYHYGPIQAVAFSPDGQWLASAAGGDDGSIRLWRGSDGAPVRRFASPNAGGKYLLAFSADSSFMASASLYDAWVHVWKLTNSNPFFSVFTPYQPVTSIALSPDGGRVAVCGMLYDGEKYIRRLQVFEIPTGIPLWATNGYPDSVAFSPDGSKLATFGNNLVELRNPGNGDLLQSLSTPYFTLGQMAFSSDSQRLTVGNGFSGTQEWELATGTLLHWLNNTLFSVAAPDWQTVAFGWVVQVDGDNEYSGRIDLGVPPNYPPVRRIVTSPLGVTTPAFSPDGKLVAYGREDATVVVAHNPTVLNPTNLPPIIMRQPADQTNRYGDYVRLQVEALGTPPLSYQWYYQGLLFPKSTNVFHDFSAENGTAGAYHVVVSNAWGMVTSQVAHISVKTNAPNVGLNVVNPIVTIGADMQFYSFVTGTAPVAYQWQFKGLDLPGETNGSLFIGSVKLSDSGQYTLVSRWPDGSTNMAVVTLTVVWPSFAARQLWNGAASTTSIKCLAVSPNNDWVATGALDNKACLWHLTDGTLARVLAGHSNGVNCLAFSRDGSLLATGEGIGSPTEGNIRVWRVMDGELIQTLPGNQQTIHTVAFSADSALVFSLDISGQFKRWRLSSGLELGALSALPKRVQSFTLSPMESVLALGCSDGQIQIWNSANWTLLQSITTTNWSTYSLAFSSDRNWLAAGGGYPSNGIEVWRLPEGTRHTVLFGHPAPVDLLQFSADSSRLLSMSDQMAPYFNYPWPHPTIAKLWQINDGALLENHENEFPYLTQLSFTPNARYLVAGLQNGRFLLAPEPAVTTPWLRSRLGVPFLDDTGHWRFSFTSDYGFTNVVFTSADLRQWTPLPVGPATNYLNQFADPASSAESPRFYRVQTQ